MSARISLTLIATSLFAAAAIVASSTHGAAQGVTATELSAQQDKNKKPAPKAAPHRATPHAAPHAAPRGNTAHRNNQKTVHKPKSGPKVVTPKSTTTKTTTTKSTTVVTTPKGTGAPKGGAGASVNAKAYTPSGPHAHAVTAGRMRGMPSHGAGHTHIRGHNYSVWRSGYRVRYGGGWRTFVAVSALTALAIGASSYYPYAYIEAPQPYCDGLTPDGCQLVWQDVPTVEGGVVSQCVAFCPWQ